MFIRKLNSYNIKFMKPTLLVLAAGMGSRYGGLKQMDGLGPNGETIIDYSIFDAVKSGFGKVVYIVREYFLEDFKEMVHKRYKNVTCSDGSPLEFDFVTQELSKIPEGFTLNPEREKPWGTAHAVLMAKDVIKEFGPMAFRLMVLSAHYRSPVNFTPETMLEAQKNYAKLASAYRTLAITLQSKGIDDPSNCAFYKDEVFLSALSDDLNTPNALTAMYAKIKQANQDLRNPSTPLSVLQEDFSALRFYSHLLGLIVKYPYIGEQGKQLYAAYYAAKEKKDYSSVDAIRKQLMDLGLWMI